jgi:hypothetical protein
MLFAAVTLLAGGLILETLLTLNVEKYLICLLATWRPTLYIIEQQLILFLKTLKEIKHQDFVVWNKAF